MPGQEVISPKKSEGEAKELLIGMMALMGFLIILFVSVSLAVVISGGSIHMGFNGLLTIANWANTFKNGVQLWQLVAATNVNAMLWWIAFILEWGAIGYGSYWLWLFWKGGRIHKINMLPGVNVQDDPFPKSVHLASVSELDALWNKSKAPSKFGQQGILLGEKGGKILKTDGETSVFVVGPTRSWKTTGLIVPNLLEWQGGVIATSTKAELVTQTAAVRQRLGPTWVYDPTGEMKDLDINSITYSPLDGCTDIDEAIKTAKALAQGLKAGGSGGEGNDWEHWFQKAWNTVAPCLYAAAWAGYTMENIRDWAFNMNLAEAEEIIRTRVQDSDHAINKALSLLTAVMNLVDREQSSAFSVSQRLFAPWWNDEVIANSATNEYDPVRLLKERGTLYLCTPADHPEEVAPLFVAILEKTITAAYQMAKNLPGERLEIPLLLALDELANVCPIGRLDSIASQGAGRGILCLTVVQDYSQLVTVYKENQAQTIFNNHPAKLFLPGITDPRTTEMISKLVGSGQVTSVSVSSGGQGSGSKTYASQDRPLITPDRIQQLTRGMAILIHKGLQPAVINLLPWFSTPKYQKMMKKPFYANTEYIHRTEEDGEEEF